MVLSEFTLFDAFMVALCRGEHHLHAGGDTLKLYLTNYTPSAIEHQVKEDIPGITEENNYESVILDKDLVVENNEVCLDIQDVVISPTGNLDGFRYVIIYNDSHPSKALIGFLDYGRVISLRNGDTLTISFN